MSRRLTTDKDIKAILAACLDQGCVVSKRNNHIQVRISNGRIVTVPVTPSDARGVRNCKALLRRSGVKL